MMLTYLLLLVSLTYKVGCQVKRSICGLRCVFQPLHIFQRIACQSERGQSKPLPMMCFDTDSFLIGVNSFASVTIRGSIN